MPSLVTWCVENQTTYWDSHYIGILIIIICLSQHNNISVISATLKKKEEEQDINRYKFPVFGNLVDEGL